MRAPKTLLVIILLTSFGCQRTNPEEKMLDCIAETKPEIITDFHILETELLERNLLSNIGRQGYLQLVGNYNSIDWSALDFDLDKLINPGIIAKIIVCQNRCDCESQEYLELTDQFIEKAITSRNPTAEMRLDNLASRLSGIDKKHFDSELFRLLIICNLYLN